MSSFIGHSLAAAAIYTVAHPKRLKASWRWGLWLLVIALIPDIDYVVPALNASQHQGLRITHSLALALLLPVATGIGLRWFPVGFLEDKRSPTDDLTAHQWHQWRSHYQARAKSQQAILAGLSHLAMDLLVGVTPLPLLWPLWSAPYRLPFGILPSAGRLNFFNRLLYHNLGIELGVVLPAVMLLLLVVRGKGHPVLLLGLSLVSIRFMVMASQLAR